MDINTAIKSRHSVRQYIDKRIEGQVLEELKQMIDQCNSDGGLNIQLCLSEPTAISGLLTIAFKNAKNYIALVGKECDDLEEKCGYYGEKFILRAQQLGLNTCWVASYRKSKCVAKIDSSEKLIMLISIGYGENSGSENKRKPIEELSKVSGTMPEWFKIGVEAARLAPTARNQQKFLFELNGNVVRANPGKGAYTKVDLGIAKYHFEIGAGDIGWSWA